MKQDYINAAPLFMGLSAEEHQVLAENFVAGHDGAETPLFRAGEQGEALYLVENGFVRLTTTGGQTLATLGPGSVLGEDSLFRDAPHDVSAVAVSDIDYWKLSDRQLRDILLQRPAIGIKLSDNFGVLLAQMQDYLVHLLANTAELKDLPRHTLEAVAQELRPVRYAPGATLFQSGETPKGLFVIGDGSVELSPELTGEPPRQAGLAAVLGAGPLLTNKAYANDAVAQSESIVWLLSAEDFVAVNSRHPGLRRGLGRSIRSSLDRSDQAQAALRLARMPIFADMTPEVIQSISQRMVLQHAPAGERVFRIGEAGNALYLIESGEIELTAENAGGVVEELARIGEDGFFGEMSLITGQIRTEDATATRHTNLWVLYKSDLDSLATSFPSIGKALSDAIATRLAVHGANVSLTEFRRYELLADLSDEELSQVAQCMEPNRYRAGEQIIHASAPADYLYLLDTGQVRMQALTGESWLLGPGDAFGERALLSNQPHNSMAVAETDVDVWTLSKADFNTLLARYPNLAISISRILSERLGQQQTAMTASGAQQPQYVSAGPAGQAAPARRFQNAAVDSPANGRRSGFGSWFGNLSTWGKVRFALLVLLIIWLIGIAAPYALRSIMSGTGLARGSTLVSSEVALNAVRSLGSYEVAAMDASLAEAVAMVDSQVPATPTYTPHPTNTPIPTNTPLPTRTPRPSPTPTATRLAIVQAAIDLLEPEPEIAAASLPVRSLDPRLAGLGVRIDDAQVAPGQQYWRLVEVIWENESEAGGKHHIYVEVLDENGDRIVNHPVTVFWGDGSHTGNTEDKKPPDYAFNYQMYASGYAYSVKVDGLPSDVLVGAGMGSLNDRFKGIHVSYKLVYQKTTSP